MQKFTFLFIGFVLSMTLHAQKTGVTFKEIASSEKGSSDWVRFNEMKHTTAETLFLQYAEAFSLGSKDYMRLSNTKTDVTGMTHYRFRQEYQGIPVWGAEYIIHARGSKAIKGNGKLVNGLALNAVPQLSAAQAVQKAIAYTGAEKYMWQDTRNENMLKHIKNNPAATYYPQAELYLADKNCSRVASAYRLAYKVNVFAEKPMSHKDIFVDAVSGDILFTVDRIHTTDVQGVAVTKYSGTQNLITDSLAAGQYRLRCNTIGGGVETYDMNKGTNYGSAVDFTDTDNYWNNTNADQDEAAADAHFAAQMTYNYYFDKLGRQSYDDNNAKLISYIHYDNNYANAFWNGYYMTYGDGNGSQYSALTSIDVCAHEITHAVTEYTANLIYQDEMGALSEGFSDIFGSCVEFYATPGLADWFIGEDFDLTGDGFRSMSDPKSAQLPDTYHGQYWVFNDVLDNGGVHTNCGVMAHWFYILAEGKVGTNDLGNSYNVVGIGIDTAAQIAYRALSEYLISTSEYLDARQATIWAAEDLYGQCSMEAINVSAAWHAVGIGFPMTNYDLWMSRISYPETACGYTSSEQIQAQIIYNGCVATFAAGDTIPVAYRIDNGPVVNDTIILANALNGGDTLDFVFNTPADFSVLGMHTIDCWTDYPNDNEGGNDTLLNYQFENKLQQNIDFGISKITEPLSACHLGSETVKVVVSFYGCDSIPGSQPITLGYRVNNGTAVTETTTIPHTLFPRDTFSYVFTTPYDLSASGTYQFKAWTEFTPDTLKNNDTLVGFSVKNPIALSADTIGFEESDLQQKILVVTTPYSNAFTSYPAHYTGAKGFQMTGGNVLDYINYLEMPTGSNNWSINAFLSAKVNFCVDATSWSNCQLRFDLKQTHGGTLYSQYLGAGDYTVASSFRILVDGVQLGGTYNPATAAADPFERHFIDLSSFAGTKFTLTFETRNIAKDTSIMGMAFKLDNAYVDNVCFSENSQEGIEDMNDHTYFDIYPNPFRDVFTLRYDSDKEKDLKVVITDVLGKEIKNLEWHSVMGTNRLEIDMESCLPGVYFIKLDNGAKSLNRKIVRY